jgi:DNA-binding NarL/FixJ family response regulator
VTVDAHRVLLVDDRADIIDLLRLMVAATPGYTVVATATTGAEAVQQAIVHQPQVVVIDYAMPQMDGMAALPLLREELPGAALILHSGYATTELTEAARRLGADAVLAKGATRGELAELMERLLAQRGRPSDGPAS